MSLIRIQNRYLDDIIWQNASFCDFRTGSHADIWRVGISANLSHINPFSAIINRGEIARANRYLHLNDRNRFIISRGALRAILGKYLNLQPSLIEFEQGANKKPFIKNSALFFNVSHSGDWIAIAVSAAEIGVDTEYINPAFNYHDIINEYFSTEEGNYIGQAQAHYRFFKLWTRKESLTKATGKGLDDDIKLVPALDGEHPVTEAIIKSAHNWLVTSFDLHENYLASVACYEQTRQLNFWDPEFSGGGIF